jgi:hypothetical protein
MEMEQFNVVERLAELPLPELRRIQEKASELLMKGAERGVGGAGMKKTRLCGACGNVGHNKANKLCPNYSETQRKRKKEKKLQRRKEKEERKRAKKRERSSSVVIDIDFDQYRYESRRGDSERGQEVGSVLILNGERINLDENNDNDNNDNNDNNESCVYFQESKLDGEQLSHLQTMTHCSICLQKFKVDQNVVRMNCMCLYHSDCAYAWWDSSQKISCPSHAYLCLASE